MTFAIIESAAGPRSGPVLRAALTTAVLAVVLAAVPAFSETPPPASTFGPLPATFFGVLPCADCKGIRRQIELRSDSRFVQTFERLHDGHNRQIEVSCGIWWVSHEGARLTLDAGCDPAEDNVRWVWRVKDTGTLRLLEAERDSLPAGPSAELTRTDSLPSIWDDKLFSSYTPCTPLADTRWVPRRIGRRLVKVRDRQHEPWLLLDSKGRKVTGSGGCNRFTGDYDKGVQTLRLRSLAATRMACPELRSEAAFLQVLEQTWGYRVTGRRLELLDEGGAVLAEFEERNR